MKQKVVSAGYLPLKRSHMLVCCNRWYKDGDLSFLPVAQEEGFFDIGNFVFHIKRLRGIPFYMFLKERMM